MKSKFTLLFSLFVSTTIVAQYDIGNLGKVFIDSDNLGIGITNPGYDFQIERTGSRSEFVVERTDGAWLITSAGTQSANFYFKSDSRFTISPSSSLSNVFPDFSNSFVVYGSSHPEYPGQFVFGSGNPGDNSKVSVNGRILSEEVKVVNNIEAPDYVFLESYNLRPLNDVKDFILQNGHLPEIPSAKEFKENGIFLGQMSFDLLKKIEELTLYLIELKESNEILLDRIKKLESLQVESKTK
jgi:hypothetical protein